MYNIITAINNPKLNIELNKYKNINIINKDIIYKEGILEILNNSKININKIIINYELPGQINNKELIKKIKLINKKIEIIFILEKEDEQKEKILKENNIRKIIYKNKINTKKLYNIIINKEIKKEKNNNLEKFKKIKKFKNIKKNKNKSKIILIHSEIEDYKNEISLELSNKIKKNKNKILLIDMKINNENIHTILNRKNAIKKIRNKEIKEKNNKFKKLEKIYLIKINKNINLITGLENYIKNNNINKIIKLIKNNNEKYNYIIIEIIKNKYNKINNELIKNIEENVVIINNDIKKIKEEIKIINNIKKIKNNKIKIYLKRSKNEISKEIIKEIFKKEKIINN